MQLPPSPSRSSLGPPGDASIPAQIRGYRVMRRLATGGTSDVLLARAEGPHGFERMVVLKVLLQQFRDNEESVGMFAREAAAYARLSHPAIVKLYDFFSERGELVMVLEYVDGVPLNKLRALLQAQGRSIDDRAATFIAWRIFGALAAAHAAKDPQSGEVSPVIHRDVNPSNVLLPWDGHVKIADFGIAKFAGMDGGTKTGLIKGTYGYMAPEQVRGEALTGRADVYAASLVLWELLARRKAVVCSNVADIAVLRAMAEPSFPPLAALRPEVAKPLLGAVTLGLTPDADRRDISAEDFCHALRALGSLEEGREALVRALASVRAAGAAPNEDGVVVSGPSIVRPQPRPASDTVPNIADGALHPAGDAPRGAPRPPRGSPSRSPPLAPRRLERPHSLADAAAPPRPPATRPSVPPPLPSVRPPTMRSDNSLALQPSRPRPVSSTPLERMPTNPPRFAPSPAERWAPPPASNVPTPLRASPSWTGAPAARPPFGTSEPYAANREGPLVSLPFRGGPSTPSKVRPRWIGLAAGVALLGVGAALAFALSVRHHAEAQPMPTALRPAATATPPAPASEARPSTPVVLAPPQPASSSSEGNITVPASRTGHRVWIDGRMAGQAPESLPVHCGRHAVRVGSHGAVQHVDVPCGGSVDVR